MSRVLLVGAFGQHNTGDEALLDVFLAHLTGFDVVVASSDPDATSARTGRASVSSSDPLAIARTLRGSDAVVVGGGTVFKRLPAATGRPPLSLLRRTLALVSAAHLNGTRVALLSVGANELTGAAAGLARRTAAMADLLVLRDEESARALADAGTPTPLRVGADAAWVLTESSTHQGSDGDPMRSVQLPHLGGDGAALRTEPRPAAAPRGGRPRLLVILSHHAGVARATATLQTALAQLCADGWAVDLQPWQTGDVAAGQVDEGLAAALIDRLPDHVRLLPAPLDFSDACRTAAGATAVLTLRFHGLVAAASTGTPVVAIAHEAKLAALARRLQQPSVTLDHDPMAIVAAVHEAAASGGPDHQVVAGERARAAKGFRLLRMLLTDGREADMGDDLALSLEPAGWTR